MEETSCCFEFNNHFLEFFNKYHMFRHFHVFNIICKMFTYIAIMTFNLLILLLKESFFSKVHYSDQNKQGRKNQLSYYVFGAIYLTGIYI